MTPGPDDSMIKRMASIHFGHLRNAFAYQRVATDQHPVTAYLSQLSANSRPTMRAALGVAAYNLTGDASRMNELPWHRLRPDDMQRLRSWLLERYASATVNRILAAVRGVLRTCQALGYMSLEQRIKASDIPPVSRLERYQGSLHISPVLEACRTILKACYTDPRPAGRRDAALLALLYGAGLRSSEVVNLDREDYSPATRSLTIRQGKGNINRQLSVSSRIVEVLHPWVLIRGQGSGPLVVPISKIGRLQPRRLTTRAIAWILQERFIAADEPPFSPRDLRRDHLLSFFPTL